MSGIQAGDIVVCVALEHSSCPNVDHHRRKWGSSILETGRYYTIARLNGGGVDPVAAHLVEVSADSPLGFCIGRFRKIRPASDEFTRKVRAMKPVRTKEPA